MRQQLKPGALKRAREEPWKETTYIVQGEYGRILAYLRRVPARTDPLGGQLGSRRAFDSNHAARVRASRRRRRPRSRERRPGLSQGGTKRRVSRQAEGELKNHLLEHVWSRIPDPLLARDAMSECDFSFRHWNTVDGEPQEQARRESRVGGSLPRRCRAPTSGDRLRAPWLKAWDRNRGETPIKGTRSRADGTGAASGRASGDSGPDPPVRATASSQASVPAKNQDAGRRGWSRPARLRRTARAAATKAAPGGRNLREGRRFEWRGPEKTAAEVPPEVPRRWGP